MKPLKHIFAQFAFLMLLCSTVLQASTGLDVPPQDSIRILQSRVANGKLKIESKQACQLRIVNESGEIVHKQSLAEGSNEVFLPDVSKGQHLLKVTQTNGKLIKMVKLTFAKLD